MADQLTLKECFEEHFEGMFSNIIIDSDCLTVEMLPRFLIQVCKELKNQVVFGFEQLMDVCGVDYQDYGVSEWRTHDTTVSGFSRGVKETQSDGEKAWKNPRFAVVYHLLSISNNHRLRLRVYLNEDAPVVSSVTSVWSSANWFEREAYDLYGFVFEEHPDLRRLLTDYGFVGHPFRKDFPLVGRVEMRYDAAKQRCVYEPVSIQPRITVPKVIRQDNQYVDPQQLKDVPDGRH